mmetsp:Transcript_19473/g.49740  ORF Transcript_19473/g.49740 Transcript_19473/m.49740 type:complete len:208 (+) Transcript_19473:397-1020(+)
MLQRRRAPIRSSSGDDGGRNMAAKPPSSVLPLLALLFRLLDTVLVNGEPRRKVARERLFPELRLGLLAQSTIVDSTRARIVIHRVALHRKVLGRALLLILHKHAVREDGGSAGGHGRDRLESHGEDVEEQGRCHTRQGQTSQVANCITQEVASVGGAARSGPRIRIVDHFTGERGRSSECTRGEHHCRWPQCRRYGWSGHALQSSGR